MRQLHELDPIRPDLEKYVNGVTRQMGESAIVLSLFTDDYKKGLDAMIQFSLAIMLDKPIFLLVKKGTVVPDKVKKLADGIEFFDEHDKVSFEKATRRLLQLAQQKGFCA